MPVAGNDPLSRLVRAQLREHMRQTGEFQGRVAEQADVSYEYLSRIMHGRQRVHWGLALRLLAVTGQRPTVGVEPITQENKHV